MQGALDAAAVAAIVSLSLTDCYNTDC